MALSGNAMASKVTVQTFFYFEKIDRIVSPSVEVYFLPKPNRLAPSMYKAMRSFMKASI